MYLELRRLDDAVLSMLWGWSYFPPRMTETCSGLCLHITRSMSFGKRSVWQQVLVAPAKSWVMLQCRPCHGIRTSKAATIDEAAIEDAGAVAKEVRVFQ